ncbi:MAG: NADH-quinone oxidoreductase subunit E [Polaribacter sp.]|jgi:NADH-quinone oxidoreductase subunit E
MTDFNYDKSLHLKDLIPDSEIEDIDVWVKKYPGNRKRPPIMPTLKIVQEYNGNYLTTEMMQAVAEYLDVPHVAVYEVATFYSMFNLKKMGKHVLSVCTNISCSLRGSDKVVKHLEDRLNIKLGETTEDGLFSIKEVECMAACGGAPMLEVDKIYHENLTPEKIDQILSNIASTQLSESKTDIENKDQEKIKKKPKSRTKKEIVPEPILHLTPSHAPTKLTEKNIEQELESFEKEIEQDFQKSQIQASVKKTVAKKIQIKKPLQEPTKSEQVIDEQPAKKKKIESQKKNNKEAKPDKNKMYSLEQVMLRSSDNGE